MMDLIEMSCDFLIFIFIFYIFYPDDPQIVPQCLPSSLTAGRLCKSAGKYRNATHTEALAAFIDQKPVGLNKDNFHLIVSLKKPVMFRPTNCTCGLLLSTILIVVIYTTHFTGAYPGFSEGGGRDPPKKLTSQTSAQLS